jgi:hypothetical protein
MNPLSAAPAASAVTISVIAEDIRCEMVDNVVAGR